METIQQSIKLSVDSDTHKKTICLISIISLGIFLIYRIVDLIGNFREPNFSIVSIIALALSYIASETMAPSEHAKHVKYLEKVVKRLESQHWWFKLLARVLCILSTLYLGFYLALYRDSRQLPWIVDSSVAVAVLLLVTGMLVLLIFRYCEPVKTIDMPLSEYEGHFNKMGLPNK